jgi:hypothetical protein
MHSCRYIFYVVLLCALLFYYVSRSHSKFKSGLNSKLVCEIVKELKILKNFLIPIWPWART